MKTFEVEAARVRVEIGGCDLDTDRDMALVEASRCLSRDEHARAESFIFAGDRDRFVRGRGYLRRRLGEFLQIAPDQIPIVVGERGKPWVFGQSVGFNLSHSGPRAVVAITSGADVGIDIEMIDRSAAFGEQIDGLADICMTPLEQRALAALGPDHRVRRFLAFWTAKEARMKLMGEGLALDPREISLVLSKGRPVGYRRPKAPHAHLQFFRLAEPDAICCLAVRRGRASKVANFEDEAAFKTRRPKAISFQAPSGSRPLKGVTP